MILVVDAVLERQDLDGDGLMTPAELINFPEAPEHAESLPSAPQEPQPAGSQPLQSETQQSLGTKEEIKGQVEAKGASLEPEEETGHQIEAKVDTLSPEGEARGQAESEGDVPGPGEDAEGQVESKDSEGEATELRGETLETPNTPKEAEAHSIQLENDEI